MYFAIRWQFEVDGNQRRLFVCFVQATNKQITNNKLTNRQANKPEQKLELSEKQPSLDLALASYQHSLQLERINWEYGDYIPCNCQLIVLINCADFADTLLTHKQTVL